VTISGRPALKVYRVTDGDSSNTIFAVSHNYTYNTDLPTTGVEAIPYSDKGFVVMRKGGDASILRKNQAKAGGAGDAAAKFQGTVGQAARGCDGTLGSEGGNVLSDD
jgi:hypothetical protein